MIHRIGFTPEQLNGLAKIAIQKHLGLFLGPIILGYAFDSMLLGCIMQQFFWNIIWCPSDRLFNQIILFSTVILSIITTLFNDALLFHCFATGFGNWYRLVQLDWIMWYPILDSLTVTLVQIFYLERAYQLHNRSKWVPIAVLPFILAGIGGALGSTITASRIPDVYDIRATYPAFFIWIGATLVADLLITSIIFYKLIKSRTGWTDTDLMINKLITISVETQLPSLIVAIGFMVSYGLKPDAGLNVFFEMFHPKVQVVGLLAVLNSRNRLRRQLNGSSDRENTFNTNANGNGNGPNVKLAAMNKNILGGDGVNGSRQATVILEDGIIVPHLGTTVEPSLEVSILPSGLSMQTTPSSPFDQLMTPKDQDDSHSIALQDKVDLKDMLEGNSGEEDEHDLGDNGALQSRFTKS